MNRDVSRVLLQVLALCVVLAQPSRSLADDAQVLFDFERDTDTWKPRADSIAVMREANGGATADSPACLRVRGRIAGGWNYALSAPQPIQPQRLYRLTAHVRVDRLGSDTLAPYLKCEFVGAAPRSSLGQVHTTRYDASRLGQWQQLQVEFQAPADARTFWLALEKGTSSPAEIDACLDEIRLETIERLSVFEQYRLKPMPEELEQVRGAHPRLYLDAARIAELRAAVTGSHAPLWRELREHADRAVKRGPPAYRPDDGSSGSEQLWQREVGNAMPVLALAYVISGDPKYLEAARAWALASCDYATWGLDRIDGMDLAAGHQLFGLGIVYDWCYADLDEATRTTIRETIARRGSAMFQAAVTRKTWWGQSYLQNHLWVNACGLAVAGLAVFDEVEDADLWIGFARDKFRRTMDALGSDGASHEGVGYWEYGVEYLLKFMHVARERLGEDLYQHDWWRNTARYPLYLSLPRRAWTRSNSIVDIADCPRGHWYGPDYLLRGLAREYRDPQAQWLAQETDAADVTAPGAPWLNLIWYDPTVPAVPPDRLPTLHHFDDMGIVSARSDWSGEESLVVLKCGPFLGHKAVEEFSYDPGGGHVHPDANHFVLFGAGQWLMRDDGYRSKWTGQHNTLLVDGRGQLGEGKQWFQGTQPLAVKSRPRIVRAESTATLDHVIGDAAEAYPADLGLERFQRHLLFLKPDVLIVADDIRLKQPQELELRFHPEQQTGRPDGAGFLFEGESAVLRLEPLTAESVRVDAAPLAIEGRHGERDQTMFTVRLARTADHWQNVVALSWAAAGQPVKQVKIERQGTVTTFRSGDRAVSLDWSTSPAKLGPANE
jgi:hypothetical protein